jgi:hypothetical protein
VKANYNSVWFNQNLLLPAMMNLFVLYVLIQKYKSCYFVM